MKKLIVAAAAALAVVTSAGAEDFPSRPITIIVPFAAGGPATILAHLIAQPLSETFGQSFYVENLPTGASNVGTTTAAKAPADGYTLLVVTPSFVINPNLYARLAYDPIRDFTPVILAVTSPHVLIVNPSFPANSVKELVRWQRQIPANTATRPPVRASQRSWRPNCSSSRSGSTSCTCRSTAALRR